MRTTVGYNGNQHILIPTTQIIINNTALIPYHFHQFFSYIFCHRQRMTPDTYVYMWLRSSEI